MVRAILEANGADGAEPLAVLAEPQGDFAESILAAMNHLAAGLRFGVGEMVAVGLIEGLRQPGLGEVFVQESLEPIIVAMSRRLDAHQAKGEMRRVSSRIAALQLVAPLILLDLHQQQLGGSTNHPLDASDVITEVVDSFVRAYRPD